MVVDDLHDKPGSKAKESKLNKLMKGLDSDGNSQVTLEEFECWVLHEVPEPHCSTNCLNFLMQISENIQKKKSLPPGMRKMVDLNVAHVRTEGSHKEGVKKIREAKTVQIAQNVEKAKAECTAANLDYEEVKKGAEEKAAASLVPDDESGWHMGHAAGLVLVAGVAWCCSCCIHAVQEEIAVENSADGLQPACEQLRIWALNARAPGPNGDRACGAHPGHRGERAAVSVGFGLVWEPPPGGAV